METHEIVAAINDRTRGGPGARRLARTVGLTESSVYRWGRPVLSDEDPEGTGAVNLFDRLEAVVRLLATFPESRWIMDRIDAWWTALMNQVRHRTEELDITDEALVDRLAALALEHGQTMAECLRGEIDYDEALREALEDRAVLDQLILILGARADHRGESVAKGRVGK